MDSAGTPIDTTRWQPNQPMHDLGAAHPGENTLQDEFDAWDQLSDEAMKTVDDLIDEILEEHAEAWRALADESVLSRDWDTPEENEAWADL
jgi:hypothetical protein